MQVENRSGSCKLKLKLEVESSKLKLKIGSWKLVATVDTSRASVDWYRPAVYRRRQQSSVSTVGDATLSLRPRAREEGRREQTYQSGSCLSVSHLRPIHCHVAIEPSFIPLAGAGRT